jgi:hypothetical protein
MMVGAEDQVSVASTTIRPKLAVITSSAKAYAVRESQRVILSREMEEIPAILRAGDSILGTALEVAALMKT